MVTKLLTKLNSNSPDLDTGFTFTQTTECRFLLSAKPEMATQAAKNVMCHMNVNRTAKPVHKYVMCHMNVNITTNLDTRM
jgi:hypothetical protein